MTLQTKRRVRTVRVASQGTVVDRHANGAIYLRSPEKLGEYPVRVTDCLKLWASMAPHRIFLAQRGPGGAWRNVTYSEALARVRRLASGLISCGLSAERPLMILSANSIEHGLLALAAMYAGIPFAPVAPAYSLAVRDFSALSYVWQNFEPAMVFVDEGPRFLPALTKVLRDNTQVVFHTSRPDGIASSLSRNWRVPSLRPRWMNSTRISALIRSRKYFTPRVPPAYPKA